MSERMRRIERERRRASGLCLIAASVYAAILLLLAAVMSTDAQDPARAMREQAMGMGAMPSPQPQPGMMPPSQAQMMQRQAVREQQNRERAMRAAQARQIRMSPGPMPPHPAAMPQAVPHPAMMGDPRAFQPPTRDAARMMEQARRDAAVHQARAMGLPPQPHFAPDPRSAVRQARLVARHEQRRDRAMRKALRLGQPLPIPPYVSPVEPESASPYGAGYDQMRAMQQAGGFRIGGR